MRKSLSKPLRPLCIITNHHLIDHPQDGWSYIDGNLRVSIGLRTQAIPEWAGMSIRVATAYVNFDDDHPITLDQIEMSIWKFDDKGLTDQNDLETILVDEDLNVEGHSAELTPTKVDIDAIKRCVGLAVG